MLTIILCMAIGAILLGVLMSDGLAGIIGGMLGLVVGLLLVIVIGECLPTEYYYSDDIELVAFKDSSGVSGSFFLGSGSIDSTFYYVYYQKDKDGNIKFGKLSAEDENVVLREEYRSNGVIKVYSVRFRKNFYNLLGICSDGNKYEIFIPRGSILKDFKLDLE